MDKLIKKWVENGVISEETSKILLEDINNEKIRKRRIKINILIYTIAIIFIGIGVISFIAANDWLIQIFNKIPVLQIISLAVFSILSLFFGYKIAYEYQKFTKLGHSLIFLSTILIGGTYALIGQNYHINANSGPLFFIWLISVLPLAYIFKNFAINLLSILLFVLFVIFYYMDLALDEGLIWTIFIPVLIGTVLYSIGNINILIEKFNKFSLSYKLVGLVPIFITLLVLTCSVEKSYYITSFFYIAPLVLVILFNLINYAIKKNQDVLFKIETCFIITFVLCLTLIIILPEVSKPFVMVLAHLAIITMITAGYNYGYKFENNHIIGITNWFLIIYIATTYSRWGWNYIEKATFFILGGLGLLIFGMFLENKRKKIIKKDN